MQLHEIHALVRPHCNELRSILDPLEQLTARVLSGDAEGKVALARETRALHERFCAHADFADALLSAYLEQHVSRGEHEAAARIRHHQTQRRWIGRALIAAADDYRAEADCIEDHAECGDLARSVRDLIQILREELRQEERDWLGTGCHGNPEIPCANTGEGEAASGLSTGPEVASTGHQA